MSPTVWGALLGGAAGLGLLLAGSVVLAGRRPRIEDRVHPYVPDLAVRGAATAAPSVLGGLTGGLLAPALQRAAGTVEQVLGGAASVRRRLDRLGSPRSVQDFRVEQVVWGLVALGGALALAVPLSLRSPGRTVPLLLLCLLAGACGVLLRENRLTAQVAAREQRVVEELPVLAELLALSVAAGEGPVAALARACDRGHGALADELSRVLAETRTGVPVTEALDRLATRTGVPALARFAEGVAVAVERGTPLADVLHAQAADVREARRRDLIETGAKREVLMMVPVVFLVLPVVVFFAFWPGVVGLRLFTP